MGSLKLSGVLDCDAELVANEHGVTVSLPDEVGLGASIIVIGGEDEGTVGLRVLGYTDEADETGIFIDIVRLPDGSVAVAHGDGPAIYLNGPDIGKAVGL